MTGSSGAVRRDLIAGERDREPVSMSFGCFVIRSCVSLRDDNSHADAIRGGDVT